MRQQNSFFQSIKDIFKADRNRTIENVRKRQAAKRFRKRTKKNLSDIFLMLAGVLSAGFGLKGFLIQNGFIDGGITGISLLTNSQVQIPLSLLIIVFNLPFLLLGYKQISKIFSL